MNFRTALLAVTACAAICVSQLSQAASINTTRSNIKNMSATFDLGGGSEIRLRESPSRPSLGSTRIDILPDGSVQMIGFFDVFFDLSVDGGGSWTPLADASPMQFDTLPVMPVSAGEGMTFDTEMLSMSLTGNAPGSTFILRESPTRQSTGHVTVLKSACLDGSCNAGIDSFFDVFTELSLDGGQSWIPAAGASSFSASSVPLPTGIWLFATGLMGLSGFARRRKFS